jgi:hypothetical protein
VLVRKSRGPADDQWVDLIPEAYFQDSGDLGVRRSPPLAFSGDSCFRRPDFRGMAVPRPALSKSPSNMGNCDERRDQYAPFHGHPPDGEFGWRAHFGRRRALIFERTGRLWASMAVHAGYNAFIVALWNLPL